MCLRQQQQLSSQLTFSGHWLCIGLCHGSLLWAWSHLTLSTALPCEALWQMRGLRCGEVEVAQLLVMRPKVESRCD